MQTGRLELCGSIDTNSNAFRLCVRDRPQHRPWNHLHPALHHPHAVQVVDQGGGQEAGGNHLQETQRGVGEVGVNLKYVRLLRNS